MIKKITVLGALAMLLFPSCSKYQQLLKSNDYEEKYQMAFVYYNQGDYYRSIQLFDQVLPFYRGTDRAETIAYTYAYAHYNQKDYMLASFYFKKLTTNYPRSKYLEECTFMSAYCKHLDSPRHSLDQSSTKEAIEELQFFINKFPGSERVDEANNLIDKLREKLELKAMEMARLYYKMENYNAAITSLNNILKDFPDTDFREEVMITILKARYDYADKSIEDKKESRFKEALETYDNYIAQFPSGNYEHEANQIQRNILRYLNSRTKSSL